MRSLTESPADLELGSGTALSFPSLSAPPPPPPLPQWGWGSGCQERRSRGELAAVPSLLLPRACAALSPDHTEGRWGEAGPELDLTYWFLFLFLRFYLFIFRLRGREGERERTSMCGCLSCAPYWGPGLQPRPVP